MSTDTDKSDDFETRSPQDGDQLFIESSWAYDAHVVRAPAERLYRMPMGYKRAGDVLIDQAAMSRIDRPNIIYAALFCYRQAIELFLKKLIDKFGPGKVYSPKNTHDLSCLWEQFMGIATEPGRGKLEGLHAAQKLVAEMHEADKRSDGFRYPSDRTDSPFVFGDRGIDLQNVREVMQGLANFFDCVYLYFSHQDDTAEEER